MGYTMVSNSILCDLLNCRSKVTDMELLTDKHAAQLHRIGFLEDIREILLTDTCKYDDNRVFTTED